MRFSAPEEALAGIVLHRPPSGLRGFVPVVRTAGSRGRPGRGPGGGVAGGGGDTMGPGTREPLCLSRGPEGKP